MALPGCIASRVVLRVLPSFFPEGMTSVLSLWVTVAPHLTLTTVDIIYKCFNVNPADSESSLYVWLRMEVLSLRYRFRLFHNI